jgi:hypothetical protein
VAQAANALKTGAALRKLHALQEATNAGAG